MFNLDKFGKWNCIPNRNERLSTENENTDRFYDSGNLSKYKYQVHNPSAGN